MIKRVFLSLLVLVFILSLVSACSPADPFYLNSTTVPLIWQPDSASPPASPAENWAYHNTTDGNSYYYAGGSWHILAEAGDTGPQGPQGPQGIQGIQGNQGIQGIQGNQGPAGANGADGAPGPNNITTSTSTDFASGSLLASDGDSVVAATSINLPTGRTATYVIAASDATATEKAQADAVCDGTADDVEINAGITALPATGGKIKLTSGTFTVNKSGANTYAIGINKSYVEFEMQPDTIITLANAQNCSVIEITAGKTNVYIHGGNIDGNKDNQTPMVIAGETLEDKTEHAIHIHDSSYCTIRDVTIYDTREHSIAIYRNATHNTVEHCYIKNPGVYGDTYTAQAGILVFSSSTYNLIKDNTIVRDDAVSVQPVATRAIYISNGSNYCQFVNNYLYNFIGHAYGSSAAGGQGDGIALSADTAITNNLISHNIIEGCRRGIISSAEGGVSNLIISGNHILSNNLGEDYENVIWLYKGSNCDISDNFIGQSGAGHMNDVKLDTCSNINFSHNNLVATAAYHDCITMANTCTNIWIDRNEIGKAIQVGTSGASVTATDNTFYGTEFFRGTTTPANIRGNKGYIASGEIRTYSGTIVGTASDNGAIILSVDNPFGQAVRVLRVNLEVTVQASAAATMDCGIGSSNTADYTTMIAALPINPGTTYPYFYSSDRTATYGVQTDAINWASGSGNRYLNFFNPSANASGTVFRATYTVTVMGN